MILIESESQIDLTKIATFSVNDLDEQICAPYPDQERFCDIASDGALCRYREYAADIYQIEQILKYEAVRGMCESSL